MKRLYVILALISVLDCAYGQRDEWETAQRFYYQFEFAAAVQAYEKVVLHDPVNMNAIEKLALCYKELNNPGKAEQWFAKACVRPDTDPQFYKLYAQVLSSNQKYKEAAQWYAMHSYSTSDKNSKRLASLDKMINQFYGDSALYKIKPLPSNSINSDFSPAYYNDGIVFCSARENSVENKYTWDNSNYIDLYVTSAHSSDAVSFGSPINTVLHEGPAVFSANYDTMYFTRNNFINGRKKSGIAKLKIFSSVLRNGKWSKAEGIDITSDEYSNGHPALSRDGKLYFVSEMPGGYGGTDLYYTKLENGVWAAPVNLGPLVNTSENEMFPFIDDNGTLYFASSGHPGLGGLDIFATNIEDGKFTQPHNIGYPINSSRDDFGYIVKGNQGYFSSNRGADPQDDNIYSFTIDYAKVIATRTYDTFHKPLASPLVTERNQSFADSKR